MNLGQNGKLRRFPRKTRFFLILSVCIESILLMRFGFVNLLFLVSQKKMVEIIFIELNSRPFFNGAYRLFLTAHN